MTYDEILRAYYDGGGQDVQSPGEGGVWQAPAPITLPDGRFAQMSPFGTLAVIDPQTRQGVQYGTDGAEYAYAEDPRSRWVRFRDDGGLAAVALPFAAAGAQFLAPQLFGGAGAAGAEAATLAAAENGILGSTVGSTAGAGGASLSELIAAQGLPAATGGMSLETAAGLLGAPAAAGAVTAGGAGLASGLANAAGSIPDFLRNNASWLLPAAGALAGVAGNGDMTTGSTSSSTTNTGATTQGAQTGQTNSASQQGLAPWQMGAAQQALARAQQLAGGPTSNDPMDAARARLMQTTMLGDPLVNAATQQQMNVIGGGMLGGNPHIDGVARDIADRMGEGYATGTRAGTFSRFNNDGNSVFAKTAAGQTTQNNDRAFGDSLGATMRQLYYGDYAGERQAQDAASRNSINLANFGVANANNLYGIGSTDFQRPFYMNQQLAGTINPAWGSQSTGTGNTSAQTWNNAAGWQNTQGQQNATMSAPNNWMAGAGGALAGAGLYRTLFPRG